MKLTTLLARFGFVCLTAVLCACTWVEPTEPGELVRVATLDQVAGCADAGVTHVSVLAKVAGVRRDSETVSEELATLARNSAVQLDGDAVVPISEIIDGAQTFAVYKCMR